MSELVDNFREHLLEGAEGGSLSVIVENYKQLKDSIISIREAHTVANRLLRDSANAERLNQSKAQTQLEALEEAYYQITSEIEHEIIVPPEPKTPTLKSKSLSFAQWLEVVIVFGGAGYLLTYIFIYAMSLLAACLIAFLAWDKKIMLSFTGLPGFIPTRIFWLLGFFGLWLGAMGRYNGIKEDKETENGHLMNEWNIKYAEWRKLKAEAERQEKTRETRRKLRATLNG